MVLGVKQNHAFVEPLEHAGELVFGAAVVWHGQGLFPFLQRDGRESSAGGERRAQPHADSIAQNRFRQFRGTVARLTAAVAVSRERARAPRGDAELIGVLKQVHQALRAMAVTRAKGAVRFAMLQRAKETFFAGLVKQPDSGGAHGGDASLFVEQHGGRGVVVEQRFSPVRQTSFFVGAFPAG